MSRFEAWLNHIATLAVGGTGLVYAWMTLLLEPEDDYALINHAWQGEVQASHLIFAPLLVFSVGLVARSHAWKRLREGKKCRRRSGFLLVLGFVPMVVSGYLLQVSVQENWRNIFLWLHLSVSAAWLLGYLLHQSLPKGAKKTGFSADFLGKRRPSRP